MKKFVKPEIDCFKLVSEAVMDGIPGVSDMDGLNPFGEDGEETE